VTQIESRKGVRDTFIADDGKGSTVSASSTNTDWFKRFMRGCHKRMGDIWIPDRALTMRELLCCQTLLEDDWATFEGDKEGRLKLALTTVMMIDVERRLCGWIWEPSASIGTKLWIIQMLCTFL
jgi:hypothetical protein